MNPGRASTGWILAAALASAGCGLLPPSSDEPRTRSRPRPLPAVQYEEQPEPTPGSLWRGDASRRFLSFENRARRPGDLVTVQIVEQAEAASEATTELERSSSFGADLDSDVGLQTLVTRPIRRLLGVLGFLDQRNDSNPTTNLDIADASTDSSFEGEGTVERESTLRTTLACIVTEVTPTGLMRIEGERYITINHETQIIRLTGYVRPEDLQIDNTVPSSLIASAEIEYGGEGVVNDQQRYPWLMRVFTYFLPF